MMTKDLPEEGEEDDGGGPLEVPRLNEQEAKEEKTIRRYLDLNQPVSSTASIHLATYQATYLPTCLCMQ